MTFITYVRAVCWRQSRLAEQSQLLSKSSSFPGGGQDAAFWALSEEAASPSGKVGPVDFLGVHSIGAELCLG